MFPGSLKLAGILTLTVILAGGGVWLRWQQHVLENLRTQNVRLAEQGATLQRRMEQLRTQTTGLSEALNVRQTQQHRMEAQSEQTRQQLRRAVVQSPCAGQPVPADIIRLQRDALERRALSR